MVASITLGADLNGCRRRGLEVVAGTLDCAGHQIAGPGDRIRGDGISVSATGAAVRNCVVRNFGKGILIDGGSDNAVTDCDVFNNNTGIWLGDGAASNELRRNRVHDNRDEGVHLGVGTSGTLVIDNEIIANRTENLYLIGTSGNRVVNNLVDRSAQAGIHLKHADDNFFSKNVVAQRGIAIRGDSSGNAFEGNQILSGRFSFQAIEEDELGWTYPHGNTVRGGRVLKASTCFYFYGAYDNHAKSVLADRCRPIQEKEAGEVVPWGNTVEVHYGGGGGGGGGGGSTDPTLPQGSITFDDPDAGRDSLLLKGAVASETPLDPILEDVAIRLTDAQGTVFELVAPAGTLRQSGRSAKYEGRDGGALPGVDLLEIRREGATTWSFRLEAMADLSAADQAAMTLEVVIGGSHFTFSDTWTGKRDGWKLR